MEKILIILFLIDDFLNRSLVAGDYVSLSDLGTFQIPFSIYFHFSGTSDSLRPGTYFSRLEIFLIFVTFLIFGGNISCVKLLIDTFL